MAELYDIKIIRNPFVNNVVSADVAQNAPRAFYQGCGCAPVPAEKQMAADGPSYSQGLGNIRSGSITRAGRYQGGIGRTIQPTPQWGGADVRHHALQGALGRTNRFGGGLGDACSTARTTTAITSSLANLLTGSAGEAGAYTRTGANLATNIVGGLCPSPTAPAVAAAPPSNGYGTTSEAAAYQSAMLKMMQDQQAAGQAQIAAMQQAKAMEDAQNASSNKTLYVVGGGAALLLLAVVLLK